MPTKQQLFKLWESEREFGIRAAHGFGSEHPDHIPTPTKIVEFTGAKIGLLVSDGAGGVKIVADPTNKKAPE